MCSSSRRRWCGTTEHWRCRTTGNRCTTSAGGSSCGATGEPLLVAPADCGRFSHSLSLSPPASKASGKQPPRTQTSSTTTASGRRYHCVPDSCSVPKTVFSPSLLPPRQHSSTRRLSFSSWDKGTATANHTPPSEKQVQGSTYQM